jgi:flavin reductase (DIM6/NTAB) family NADH-FMN oxidoreductase RutF
VNPDEPPFERIAATISSPVVIVTTHNGDDVAGCLVGFSTQCSIEPRRELVCLSKANRTYEVARTARAIVVHVLHAATHDRTLARLFGEETGFETDKFAQCTWRLGPDGVPVLDGCDWFTGTIVEQVDLGDHVGFVLDVTDHGEAHRAHEPYLAFPDVRDLDPGNPT